jgi:hypothetical protein
VKVRHDEDIASHIGPESCADIREDEGEALTGEHTGQPSSRERTVFWMPTLFQTWKAKRRRALSQAFCRSGVVEDPGMYGRSLRGNREISGSTTRSSQWSVVRIGKARNRSR